MLLHVAQVQEALAPGQGSDADRVAILFQLSKFQRVLGPHPVVPIVDIQLRRLLQAVEGVVAGGIPEGSHGLVAILVHVRDLRPIYFLIYNTDSFEFATSKYNYLH